MFFFVTTIVVAIFGLAVVLVAYYAIKTLEQARRVLKKAEEHVSDARDELKDILYDVQESTLYRFLFRRKSKR